MVTKTTRRVLAAVAIGALLVSTAGCGKSDSSSGERDRNVAGGVGTQAGDNPAPYQAVIYRLNPNIERYPDSFWNNPNDWGFQCAAVIINKRWLATLNSCVSYFGAEPKPKIFHVGVGKLNPWAPTLPQNVGTLIYGVETTYTGDAYKNFALVKTDRDIVFSDKVQPIALPFGMEADWPQSGTIGQISGWGSGNGVQPLSDTLRWANVDVSGGIDATSCGPWSNFWGEQRICLTKSKMTMGGLACNYDQGGPFVVNVADKPMLAGLIADIDTSGACKDGAATLAVRMREMLRWIASGPVKDFVATPDDGTVTLSWSKPWTDWGPEPFDYTIEMSEDGKTWETLNDGVNTNTEVTFGDLTNGKELSFRIAALNDVIAENPEQRYYSEVVKVTVGHQEPPVNVGNQDVAVEDPHASDPAPALPGGTEAGATEAMKNPAAPAGASAPASTPTTSATSGVVAAAATVQLSTFTPIDVTSVVKTANVTVPTGGRVAMTVDKSAKSVCAVQGSALVALKTGKCKVKVVVTVKGKKQSKSTTIQVSK